MGNEAKQNIPLAKIYLLPNLFTAGNLFFGFLCLIRCIQARYSEEMTTSFALYNQAVWCIFGSLICDGLDGRLARLGGRESLFGKEFDSLADVVSFGLAPAMIVFFLILSPENNFPFFRKIGWLIGFFYLLCGAVRLARFNVITHPLLPKEQLRSSSSHSFIGLPIPAAASVIASLVLVINRFDLKAWALLLPPLMLLIAWLMISNVYYPSFKHIDWTTETKLRAFVLIIIALVVIITFEELSCAILSLTYVFYGLFRHLQHRKKVPLHHE
ncbi:MAG: CDP-diacylglycerol--serine O-phosphatidyltransferase [Opitutales bacterium]|nr:CDP-diacylglycerol--serine O-phosphatidyltransferase [Opitutales bacterium]